MIRKFLLVFLTLLFLLTFTLIAQQTEEFKFGDTPVSAEETIKVDAPKPAWMTIGGPIALLVFFFGLIFTVFKMLPYRETPLRFDLHDLPIAAQRGIGMAVIMFGISFSFGAFEARYQIGLHGDAQTYFHEMGLGKLIAITHAHLIGFTTSFFIIGIPFSLHFNRLKIYQLIFPLGLAASLTDIISWWGLKFVSPYFEYITWWCGFVFTVCYIWMLIGLVRIIFFPNIHWFPDYINDEKLRKQKEENSKN
ncbi:MAG TPA: hypothetical protein PK079_08500 [Leptospiraceae bacterium]|nr:hypothetical protein [Leptospiraceae bacterium]HMW04363.1 hypothetical protein [Leptospiraceae bacterium]HMX31067.1 hypothetical protein [Leptospiraceae bacterium]HMY31883.1 hypothetical protein [Leptospiraceae bacterium]HMZ65241.1 hypothetical protein [Leptospiraceae bacterium]